MLMLIVDVNHSRLDRLIGPSRVSFREERILSDDLRSTPQLAPAIFRRGTCRNTGLLIRDDVHFTYLTPTGSITITNQRAEGTLTVNIALRGDL